jgi:hypothetical protein
MVAAVDRVYMSRKGEDRIYQPFRTGQQASDLLILFATDKNL